MRDQEERIRLGPTYVGNTTRSIVQVVGSIIHLADLLIITLIRWEPTLVQKKRFQRLTDNNFSQ